MQFVSAQKGCTNIQTSLLSVQIMFRFPRTPGILSFHEENSHMLYDTYEKSLFILSFFQTGKRHRQLYAADALRRVMGFYLA